MEYNYKLCSAICIHSLGGDRTGHTRAETYVPSHETFGQLACHSSLLMTDIIPEEYQQKVEPHVGESMTFPAFSDVFISDVGIAAVVLLEESQKALCKDPNSVSYIALAISPDHTPGDLRAQVPSMSMEKGENPIKLANVWTLTKLKSGYCVSLLPFLPLKDNLNVIHHPLPLTISLVDL